MANLAKFIISSMIKPMPSKKGKRHEDDSDDQRDERFALIERCALQYKFIKDHCGTITELSQYVRKQFLVMINQFYYSYVLIHKGLRIGEGLMNPKIVVPEGGDNKYPPLQYNHVYAIAYDGLYKYITSFLSENIAFLLFDGAQRVVFENEVDSISLLFDFPSSLGTVHVCVLLLHFRFYYILLLITYYALPLYLDIQEDLRSIHLNTVKNSQRRTLNADSSSWKASVEYQNDEGRPFVAKAFIKNRKRDKSDIGPDDEASDDKMR